jgi:hypothetical protein
MCTVTYIPTSHGAIFSSNRDEHPLRSTLQPQCLLGNAGVYISPIDEHKQGTWMGVHSSGYVLILLNGGFVNHQRKAAYKQSRGLVVTDLLDTYAPLKAWQVYDLENIEPFTLILWQQGMLRQLVWDGEQRHILTPDATRPAIWSSATLYTTDAKAQRETKFHTFTNNNRHITTSQLLDFVSSRHDSYNGFTMHRSAAMQTVSISLVTIGSNTASFQYHDLLTLQDHHEQICLTPNNRYANT